MPGRHTTTPEDYVAMPLQQSTSVEEEGHWRTNGFVNNWYQPHCGFFGLKREPVKMLAVTRSRSLR